jgi:hypothetical protein
MKRFHHFGNNIFIFIMRYAKRLRLGHNNNKTFLSSTDRAIGKQVHRQEHFLFLSTGHDLSLEKANKQVKYV